MLEALERIERELAWLEAIQGDHEARLQHLERSTYVSSEGAKRLFASCGLDPATTEGSPTPVLRVTKRLRLAS